MSTDRIRSFEKKLNQWFGVTEFEFGRLVAVGTLWFLLMGGIEIGRIGRDGYFLKEAGPSKIPVMYLLNAVFMLVIYSGYSRLVDRVARHKFLIGMQIATAVAILTLRFLIPARFEWLPAVIFCTVESLFLLFMMHFWTFANGVFDPREGKRIFPLLAGAGLMGTIAGSLICKPLSAWIGTINLFFVWAGTLLLCIPLALRAYKSQVQAGTEHKLESKDAPAAGFFESVGYVWSVPLLRTLTYMTIPMWVVIYVIEFHYYRTMNSVFPDQDELTGFLGLFVGLCSVAGLILQVTLTGRLLQRFGVGATTLIYPFSLTVGTVALMFYSLFPPSEHHGLMNITALVALSRFCDIAIYFSVFDSASQLLYNSLPDEKRGQGRAFVSGIIMPLSTASAGAMLLWMDGSAQPLHNIAFVGLNLAFLLVVFGLNINGDYLKALLFNLNSRDVDLRSQAMSEFGKLEDTETRFVLLQSVSSSDEEAALFALTMLRENNEDHELVEDLAEILPDASDRVKAAILAVIHDRGTKASASVVRPHVTSENPAVRAAAVRALGKISDSSTAGELESYLEDEDEDVQTEAIIALLKRDLLKDDKPLRRFMKSKKLEDLRRTTHIITESGREEMISLLFELGSEKDNERQTVVLQSMGRTHDPRIVPYLAGFLRHPVLGAVAADALTEASRDITPVIAELKAQTDPDTIAELIRCLGRAGRPEAIAAAAGYLVNHPTRVMNAAIETLSRLKTKLTETGLDEDEIAAHFPDSVRSAVSEAIGAIVNRMRKDQACIPYLKSMENPALDLLLDAVERANRAREGLALSGLGILNDSRFVQTARMNLASSERRSRAEAIEMIEGLGQEGRTLALALEERYAAEPGPVEEHPELFRELIGQKRDPWLCICALYAVGMLKLKGFESDINPLQDHEDRSIRLNAALALSSLNFAVKEHIPKQELKDMALDMERILFLRGVLLFSELEGRDLEWINELSVEKKFKSGDQIFKEGDPADTFYVILRGKARLARGKKDTTLALLDARSSFGEECLVESGSRTYNAECTGAASILEFRASEFQRLMHAKPQCAVSVSRILLGRLRELELRLVEAG